MTASVELDIGDARAESDRQSAIANLLRALRAADGTPLATWALTAAAAVELPSVDYASIFIAGPGVTARHHGSSHDHAGTLNALELRHRQGPGVDAACERQTRRVDDLADDGRWPEFSAEATAMTPIRTILSLPLWTHHHRQIVLNLYADQPNSFGPEGELLGRRFAVDAEGVLEASFRERRQRKATTNRDLIGQAKRILMVRLGIGPVTACSLLARLSRHRHQSVTALAADVVAEEHGRGPGRVVTELAALLTQRTGPAPEEQ